MGVRYAKLVLPVVLGVLLLAGVLAVSSVAQESTPTPIPTVEIPTVPPIPTIEVSPAPTSTAWPTPTPMTFITQGVTNSLNVRYVGCDVSYLIEPMPYVKDRGSSSSEFGVSCGYSVPNSRYDDYYAEIKGVVGNWFVDGWYTNAITEDLTFTETVPGGYEYFYGTAWHCGGAACWNNQPENCPEYGEPEYPGYGLQEFIFTNTEELSWTWQLTFTAVTMPGVYYLCENKARVNPWYFRYWTGSSWQIEYGGNNEPWDCDDPESPCYWEFTDPMNEPAFKLDWNPDTTNPGYYSAEWVLTSGDGEQQQVFTATLTAGEGHHYVCVPSAQADPGWVLWMYPSFWYDTTYTKMCLAGCDDEGNCGYHTLGDCYVVNHDSFDAVLTMGVHKFGDPWLPYDIETPLAASMEPSRCLQIDQNVQPGTLYNQTTCEGVHSGYPCETEFGLEDGTRDEHFVAWALCPPGVDANDDYADLEGEGRECLYDVPGGGIIDIPIDLCDEYDWLCIEPGDQVCWEFGPIGTPVNWDGIRVCFEPQIITALKIPGLEVSFLLLVDAATAGFFGLMAVAVMRRAVM